MTDASEVGRRLEEAAFLVAAISRQWRETASHDDSVGVFRTRIEQVIEMTETTARNLVKIAATRLPDDWELERRIDYTEVEAFIRANKERLEAELKKTLQGETGS